MVRRSAVVLATVLLVAAALWYLEAPPRSVEAYRSRAEGTASSLLSQARAADLWADSVARGRVTHQAAVVAVEELEFDTQTTSATLTGWTRRARLTGCIRS